MARSNALHIGWRLLRPPTLTASITPVLVGTGLALSVHAWRLPLLFAMLIAAMLIQAVANMFNEYFDFKRGLDHPDMTGISGTIVRDNVSPGTVLLIAWATLVIAILLGVYIAVNTSWWVAVAGALSMLFMFLYSAGPFPISYTPFGELTAGIIMGPVMILISYYIQTDELTARALFASIPIGLLIGAILLANNIRDLKHDVAGGRKTLPITIGRVQAIRVLGMAFALSYAILITLVITATLSPWSLLALLSLPLAIRTPRLFVGAREPRVLQQAFKLTSLTLIAFGLLLFSGLVIAQ